MTKVKIEPGVCGLSTKVTAHSEDGMEVTVKICSACKAVQDYGRRAGRRI